MQEPVGSRLLPFSPSYASDSVRSLRTLREEVRGYNGAAVTGFCFYYRSCKTRTAAPVILPGVRGLVRAPSEDQDPKIPSSLPRFLAASALAMDGCSLVPGDNSPYTLSPPTPTRYAPSGAMWRLVVCGDDSAH